MKCVLKVGDEVVAKLNSDAPIATNTIKPRKEFDKLKTRLTTEPQEELKPTITLRTHDDVGLKCRVRGPRKDQDVDSKAIREQEKLERNSDVIPVNLNVQYTDNVVESKFKAEVFDSEVKSYDTIEEQLEDENDTEIQSAKDYIAGQEELAEAIRKEQLEISEQTKRELLEESRIAEEIRKEEYVEPVVITTPTETNSGGFTIGELLGEKLQGAINENYKTEDVVSPIESHYSAAPETKAEDEIPTLIIHPRNENTEEEKLEEY